MGRLRKLHLPDEIYTSYLLDYREYVSVLGFVYNSQLSKTYAVLDFLQWLIDKELTNIGLINPGHIKAYHQYLKNRPCRTKDGVLSSGSIQHHFCAIRLFFSLLQENNILIKNPMSVVKIISPREKAKHKSVMSIAEVMDLYRHSESLMERAFLSLCYGCGLRSMELVAINLEDLHLEENYIVVPRGKGNKKRFVPITQRIRNDIEQYIAYERMLYLNDKYQKALFVNTTGERARRYTFVSILRKMIDRTENEEIKQKEIRPHHLRHSIATHLLEQGVTVEQVRNFLGHSKLETTQEYVRVSQKQLKELL